MNYLIKKYSLPFFIFSFIAAWVILIPFAQSQNVEDFLLKPEVKFEYLTMAEGLSNSMVYSVAQDRRGFMWFGTLNGLNRYDGYNFTVYSHNPKDTNSLSDNTVFSIIEDHKGILWIGTANGLNQFDPVTEKIIRYQHQPTDSASLSDNYIKRRAMCVDRTGVLWIGTNKGLNQFNSQTKTFKHYMHQTANSHSISDDDVTAVFEDSKGILWIGSSNGLNRKIPGEEGFHTPDTDPQLQKSVLWGDIFDICEDNLGFIWIGTSIGIFRRNPASGIFEQYNAEYTHSFFKDNRGLIWFGTSANGLFYVDPTNGRVEHFTHDPNKQSGLSSLKVFSILEAQSGAIWIGTATNGINKINFSNQPFTVYRPYLNLPESLKNADVHSLYEDKKGNIWMGTSGNGLFKLDPTTGKVSIYKHDPDDAKSLSYNVIFEILQDSLGMFWIGTWRGLNYFNPETGKSTRYNLEPDNPNGVSDNAIITILPEENGALWIGSVRGGLKYFDPRTKQLTHYRHDPADPFSIGQGQINSIIKDDNGDLWISTEGGGLNKMDHKTGRFYAYKHDPKDSTSLNTDMVMYVYRDKSNIIWVGTRGGGLNKMDSKTGKFTTYTTQHGLSDNYIVGILEDSRGNLWISTKNGLCSFNPKTEVFQQYDMQDGLHSNDFKIECLYKNQRGQMYFGGMNGFTIFHPDSVRSNTYVPPVYITGFRIFDKPVNFNEKQVILSYQENFFSFDFVALNYHNSEQNKYAYQLQNFDKDWIYSGSRRYASYTNLDPGTYKFLVKGSNNDGIWNEQGASMTVIISPPWWRTWWAYSVYGICFLAGIFAVHRIQRRRLIAKEREKVRERELVQARELEKAYKQLGQQKEELQTTLEDLQATQTQLIQKEKMASLGELTAGIAHEIQNPLNFVNNFSEVNAELFDELEQEIDKGDLQEAKAIVADLKENEQKIAHHGRRADSIVKSMLQHSRATSGEKQLIDINALLEEYLRLAYHGLRAKEKDFNADFKIETDPSIGKIEVVPQEIGRVLLNLFNNAFYATSQKKSRLNRQYQPQVLVSTRMLGDKIEIRVKDNGTGIPESVKHKIFQPFFTTKPTGEGTGLGLSLSYDIITKGHGGELNVESWEGEGTEFIIRLPFHT